jgi:DNA-binding MarR family transcriptional regulator
MSHHPVCGYEIGNGITLGLGHIQYSSIKLILEEGDKMPVKFILNDPRLQAYLKIHQTVVSLIKCEEEALKSSGLTREYLIVLMATKNLPSPFKENELADCLDRGTNAVTMIMDRMVRKGLAERIQDSKDLRVKRVVTTPKAEEAYQKSSLVASKLISEILLDLTDTEVQSLNLILEKILDKTLVIRSLEDKIKVIKHKKKKK